MSKARALLASAGLVVAAVVTGSGGASAAPPCVASTDVTGSGSFCVGFSLAPLKSDLSTVETQAAAPMALRFILSNASETPASSIDFGRWLSSATVNLFSSAAGLHPVINSNPAATIAVDNGCASDSSGQFTACTVIGNGAALANVTGTGGLIDGVNPVYFGIKSITRTPTAPSDLLDLDINLSVCVNTSLLGACTGGEQAASLPVAIPVPSGTAPTTLTVPLETSVSYTLPYPPNPTVHADISLSSLNLQLPITDTNNQAWLQLPTQCGTVSADATFSDRVNDQLTIPAAWAINGCPTVDTASATGVSPYVASFSAAGSVAMGAGLDPSRTITHFHWTFGDGSSTDSFGSGVVGLLHSYSSSAARTVTVSTVDSMGAQSAPKIVSLAGSAISLTSSAPSVTFGYPSTISGKLTLTTGSAVGRPIKILRCRMDHTSCALVSTPTTGTGGAFTFNFTPTASNAYLADYVGGAGVIGTSSWYPVTVRPAIKVTQSAAAVALGGSIKISGSVAPNHAGQQVVLQAYLRGAWTTIATQSLTSTSTFAFTVKPGSRGAWYYQVLKSADSDHLMAVSHPLFLTVT